MKKNNMSLGEILAQQKKEWSEKKANDATVISIDMPRSDWAIVIDGLRARRFQTLKAVPNDYEKVGQLDDLISLVERKAGLN